MQRIQPYGLETEFDEILNIILILYKFVFNSESFSHLKNKLNNRDIVEAIHLERIPGQEPFWTTVSPIVFRE